ncbi:uncharacterized protein EI90DRAFT_3135813 [Cantharellus anzutake]|uniref:uncharacterized protein n=1 Tax=Cantharellus anzutake TaxID=1750568 RepID=UPI0019067D1C|nr:uncharacterized protein EI90DRAFT_3135813 [Cantharellus anzutake]KAF8314617.1 hypothetical protein EI90DRAFT_3135813 [Cantharellus anzutake]
MSKKFTPTQWAYFTYELEALGVLEVLTKWLDELTGGRKLTVVTDHKGHTNKVADALSQYYESSSDKDVHYDDYISADIRIDKEGDDLPLACAEEARELLHLHRLKLQCIRLDLEASKLDPPDDHQGRRELSLEDVLLPLAELRPHVEDKAFITSVKDGYSKHTAWKGILAKPEDFPKFSIVDGLIFRLNDSGKPQLVLPESIHKGERIMGIAIEHAVGEITVTLWKPIMEICQINHKTSYDK